MNDIEKQRSKKEVERMKALFDSEDYRNSMAIGITHAFGHQLVKAERDGLTFEDAFALTKYHYRVQAEVMNAVADTLDPSMLEEQRKKRAAKAVDEKGLGF